MIILLAQVGLRVPRRHQPDVEPDVRCAATTPGDGLLVERAQRAARRLTECLRHFLAAAAPLPQPCRPTERRGRRAHDAGTERYTERIRGAPPANGRKPAARRHSASLSAGAPAEYVAKFGHAAPAKTADGSDDDDEMSDEEGWSVCRDYFLFSHSTRAFEVRGKLSAAVRRRATHEPRSFSLRDLERVVADVSGESSGDARRRARARRKELLDHLRVAE